MGSLIAHRKNSSSSLSLDQYRALAQLPAASEWLANIDNPQTRRAYQADIQGFTDFVGLTHPDQFREVQRAHVLAWRTTLVDRQLSSATIRRKLAALTSLFDYLLDKNAISGSNPVKGIKRPTVESNEGKTPALSDMQAKALLNAPDEHSIKGLRDRALLAVLLYHGLRREEACRLNVEDLQERRGINHLRIQGKGQKLRYIPLHPIAAERIYLYLEADPQRPDVNGPLFRSIRGRSAGKRLQANGIYAIVGHWAAAQHINVAGLGVHGLRATAATNALENNADIAKVQYWLGHANISTTRLYDRRGQRPEDSPTFKVSY